MVIILERAGILSTQGGMPSMPAAASGFILEAACLTSTSEMGDMLKFSCLVGASPVVSVMI
jgi:hypothetical protein